MSSYFARTDFYSRHMSSVRASPTLAMAARAKKMQSEGLDVIDMSVGEPDFRTPQNICAAAIDGINNGNNRYTDVGGSIALKRAIAGHVSRIYGIAIAAEQVAASTGAKQSLYNILAATLNPEDEVVIIKPYWVSYPDMVIMAGGKPVFCDFDPNSLEPDLNSLKVAINRNTKWLIINSPSNPTGIVYSRFVLEGLAKILMANPNVQVISDDIYGSLVYGSETFISLGHINSDLWERMVIVNGLSKAYAMTGWRLGYAVGHPQLIKKITAIQSQVTSCPSSITQIAAIEALNGPPPQEFATIFAARRDMAMDILSKAPGLHLTKPGGAFYVFPSIEKIIANIKSDSDFCDMLLDKYLVSSVAGSAFGAPGYFRISYAMADADLRQGCELIVKACEGF